MEEENTTTQPQTPEELAEEQAAFSAAFNKTDQEPVIETPEEPAEPVEPKEDPPAEEPPAEEPAEKPLTREELRQLLDAQKQENIAHTTKLSGQIGELKQRQLQLEAAKTKAVGLSPKAKERLAADFPELVSLLFDEDEEPAEPPAPVVATPPAPTTPASNEPDPQTVEEAKALLAFDHPDFETVIASEKYLAWLETLPPAVKNKVQTSYDPIFGSSMLTKFKAWDAAQTPPPPPPKPKNNAALEAAVTPRGTPRTAVAGPGADDEESTAFKAAFKKPR